MANRSDLSPAGSGNSNTDPCIVVCNDKMHQSGPTSPPPEWFHMMKHHTWVRQTSFFFSSSNALTNCSCSFHTKSCNCTLRSFIIFFVLASFAELLCDLFSVSEKPNYGHWVMSEQTILWDQHCLCQSYRKHKWPTDRGTKRFLVRFFFFLHLFWSPQFPNKEQK